MEAMCGLFGAASVYLSDFEIENVKDLGVLSYFRGRDATGIIHVSRPDKQVTTRFRVRYRKTLDNPINFWTLPEVDDLIHVKGRQTMAMVGHTRAATYGDRTVQNAHPYKRNHIIGMHNGTIPRLSTVAGKATDSKVLFDLIATRNLEAALSQVQHGSFALVWVDKSDMTIKFIRNEHRPLWFCTNSSRNTLYWASDPDWFPMALGVNMQEPYQLRPDHLCTLRLDTMETELVPIEYDKPEKTLYANGGWYHELMQ